MLYDSDEIKPHINQVQAPSDKPEVDWSELDWTGWKENSLTTQLGQWVKSKTDPTYVIPGSMEDLDEQEVYLKGQIEQLQEIDSPKAKRIVSDYFNELEDVSSRRNLLKAEQEAEIDLEVIWDSVSDDPERFLFNMAQETINKPELLIAGAAGGYGWGVLGARAAVAVKAGATVTKVAKVAGSATGAYTGGVALGTLDRSIENANKTGEFRVMDAYEQSTTDGIIALAGLGLGYGLRRGARGLKGNKNKAKFKQEAGDLETSSFDDTVEALDLDDVSQATLNKEAFHPVDSEIYLDPQGNTFVVELTDIPQDLPDYQSLVAAADNKIPASELKTIRATNRKLNSQVAHNTVLLDDLKVIDKPDAKQKSVDIETKINNWTKEIESNNVKLYNHQKAMDAQNTLYGLVEEDVFQTPEFIKIPNAEGIPTLLRKADPELSLRSNNIQIDGFTATDFSMSGQASGYKNSWEAIMTNWYRSATSPLQPLRESSPSAALLLEKLNPNSANPKARMWSLQEDITFNQGYFNNKMKDILVELREKYPGKDYEKKVMLHMRNVEPSEDVNIQKASIGIRNLLDEHREYMTERGAKVDTIEDYLPRRWNKDKLRTDEGKALYEERLMVAEGRTRTQAEASWKKIIENRELDEDGVLTAKGLTKDKQPYGSRSLKNLKDSEISDLLSESFFEDIIHHTMTGTRRAEMAKVFGDDGIKLRGLMKNVSKEMEAKGRPLHPEEQQRIYDIYNSFNGNYHPIKSEAINVVNNSLATVTNLSKLGMATITSLTEPLVMLSRINESSGTWGALNTYIQAGRAGIRKAFKGMKEHEFITEAREMGLITDQAIAEVLDQMQGTGMDGKLATINHKWFKATGLHQWTELSRGMAYGSAKADIQKTIAKLAGDQSNVTRRRWLTEVGLDPEEALEWVKTGDVQAPFYTELKRASVRMANEIIANPNPVNKPLWMSNPKMKLIAQLKAYPIVFGNVILKRQWEEFKKLKAEGKGTRKAANLAVTAGTMATGYYMLGMFKDALRGNDLDLDDEEKQVKNITRAVTNLLGPVGVISPVIEGIGERYGSNSLMSSVAPIAGTVGKLVEDPARGLMDAVPGSTLIPTELKKEASKELKEPFK